MLLSERAAALRLPTGGDVATLEGMSTPLGQLAARMRVLVPSRVQPTPELQRVVDWAFLSDWGEGARVVTAELFARGEHIDEVTAKTAAYKLSEQLAGLAPKILQAVGASWFFVPTSLPQVVTTDIAEVTSSTLRLCTYYAYTAASAGAPLHNPRFAALGAKARGDEWMARDYALRAGTFQAIVVLAKLGLYDKFATWGTAGLGVAEEQRRRSLGEPLSVGVIVVIVVAIVAALAALAWVAVAMWEVSSRNRLVRDLVLVACQEEESSICSSTLDNLSSGMATTQPTPSSDVTKYVLLGVGTLGAVIALPEIIRALRGAR